MYFNNPQAKTIKKEGIIMESIWSKNSKRPEFNKLKRDIKTDVLIIGGGMAGILSAYKLRQAGVNCVIAETDKICSGVTENTTAKITYHHGAVFDKMIKTYGPEITELYVEANQKALMQYKNLCRNIDCDFNEQISYVYSINDREKIEKEVLALNKIGCKAGFEREVCLPFDISGAVRVDGQAEFNPLKFAYSIAEDLEIYESTKVLEVVKDGAITVNGKITAKYIIVATHFPFMNKYGGYFLKMHQQRSYVIALNNAQKINGMYVDEAENGLSFRNYKDLLLLGGGGHRTGKHGGNFEELRDFAKKYYKNSNEVCYWATQDCKTLDDIPYIGQYSKKITNVFVATGFNKWGMTSSMVSAMLITDLILGKDSEYKKVFTPERSILHPQFFINAVETAKNLITPTKPRCPHLGCALKYNKVEHSWDCPCHGSRFTKDGELIDNPATDDMKKLY